MIIVAGHLTIDPDHRQDYLDKSIVVVTAARQARGCLDFSMTADTVESDRINVFELWESEADAEAFRGDGPSNEQMEAIDHAVIEQYEIASSMTLT